MYKNVYNQTCSVVKVLKGQNRILKYHFHVNSTRKKKLTCEHFSEVTKIYMYIYIIYIYTHTHTHTHTDLCI